MEKLDNFIGGNRVAPSSGTYFDSFNPTTGQVHQQLADSDHRDVEAAVLAAKSAFPAWAAMELDERSQILYRISEAIMDHRQELAELESRDQGKPVSLAHRIDIPRASLNFRFFSQALTQFVSESTTEPGVINYVRRDPLGVAGLISPWNLPLYLLTWKIAPAIAAGNTAVCKPSEITSATASALCELMTQAGLPAGVVNIVFGLGSKVGEALVGHKDVPLISFTGGTETGARISQVAAPMFKKLSLELGGKNANVVFADCNLEKAIETSVRAAFTNQGEICLCGSRVFVEDSIYDKFLEGFVSRVKALKVGDPRDPDTFMGPVVSLGHRDKVLSYMKLASEQGTIHCGGGALELSGELKDGYFLAPTVVTDLPEDSALLCEEIFGPVVTISRFQSESEVLERVNGIRFGLSASVWTENLGRAQRMAEKIEAATVWVNTWMKRDLRAPFGGQKDSGVGREGGVHSLSFFTEEKNVCMEYAIESPTEETKWVK